MAKITYSNFVGVITYESGKRSQIYCEYWGEAFDKFNRSIGVKMVLWQATHNNTRLKLREKFYKEEP